MRPEESFRLLGEHYLDYPNEISLETLALCNAACVFCPYPTLERKGERMSDLLLEKLLREMETFEVPFTLSPFKVNEPFLDKRLLPICYRVNDRIPHGYLRIFSNGSALTKEKLREVATLKNVKHLWISLNSHKADEYEAVMKIPFDRTAKKLDMLHEMDFPHEVVLSKVGGPDEAFRMYCCWRWPKFRTEVLKRDAWIDYIEPQSNVIPHMPCARWWELSIMANGVVSLCCMDGTGQYAIGDVNKQTMLEVYNSPHWRDRRERMLDRHEAPDPCNRCSYGS